MDKNQEKIPIDELLNKEINRIAYKLAECRGFGRPLEDWLLAERIINDKNWQGTGKSYRDVLETFYKNNP